MHELAVQMARETKRARRLGYQRGLGAPDHMVLYRTMTAGVRALRMLLLRIVSVDLWLIIR